jgi:hypothetical protein
MKPNYIPLEHRHHSEKVFSTNGYVYVKVDGKRVFEHRIVMENLLGRKLERYEHIHHKNGDRADNNPDNLELWVSIGKSKKDPKGQRIEDILQALINQPEIIDKTAVEIAFKRVFKI